MQASIADLKGGGAVGLRLWLNGLRVQRGRVRSKTTFATLCEGDPRGGEAAVRVRVARGRVVNGMGFAFADTRFLWPEEALYLLDRGALTLEAPRAGDGGAFADAPWTGRGLRELPVDTAYARLCSVMRGGFATYLTYAHLRKLGYVVLRPRHRPEAPPAPTLQQLRAAHEARAHAHAAAEAATPASGIDPPDASTSSTTDGGASAAGGSAHAVAGAGARAEDADDDDDGDDGDTPAAKRARLEEAVPGDGAQPRLLTASRPELGRDGATVAFHCWAPVGPFKRSDPGPPGFAVVVTDCDAPLPSATDVARIRASLPPETDLRFAAVDQTNTVMFYSVSAEALGAVAAGVL